MAEKVTIIEIQNSKQKIDLYTTTAGFSKARAMRSLVGPYPCNILKCLRFLLIFFFYFRPQ